MLSKSLIQFSVMGGAVFPPCYLPGAKLWTTDFPGGSDSKVPMYNAGDPFQSLDWEDTLEKEVATHPSTLARKIPWMGEPSML